jgi:hypothetical protein
MFAEQAHAVVDAGCVALLVICLQEPDVGLKRACANTLGEIASHSVEVSSAPILALLMRRMLHHLYRQVPKFWTYGSVCCECAQRPGLPRACHSGLLACLAPQAVLSAHVACAPRAAAPVL